MNRPLGTQLAVEFNEIVVSHCEDDGTIDCREVTAAACTIMCAYLVHLDQRKRSFLIEAVIAELRTKLMAMQ